MKDDLTRKLPITYEELEVCKASGKSRIGGKLLDSIIEIIVLIIALIMIFIVEPNNTAEEFTENIIIYFMIYQIIAFILNLVVPVLTKGQTIGKMAAGTRIIYLDGNIGNLIIYLVRQSFYTVLAILGQVQILTTAMGSITLVVIIACFIQIFSDSHGRTLQDMFAKTMVVNDKVYQEFRYRRFYEIDHPEEFIVEEEKSLEGSIEYQEEFE